MQEGRTEGRKEKGEIREYFVLVVSKCMKQQRHDEENGGLTDIYNMI